jgi:hypothetical protein
MRFASAAETLAAHITANSAEDTLPSHFERFIAFGPFFCFPGTGAVCLSS